MFKKNKMLTIVSGVLSFISLSVGAQAVDKSYIIVAPQCLIKNANIKFETLSSSSQALLIKINESAFNQLIAAKNHQKELCGGFVNVTDAYASQHVKSASSKNAFLSNYVNPHVAQDKSVKTSYAINHTKEVTQMLSIMNPQEMWKNLTTLSSFHDRYAGSDTGVDAAKWIKSQVEQMAKDNNRSDVTTSMVSTGFFYKQPSVVVKLGDSNEAGVVIGAHMDTLQAYSGDMPGADDDGTGTVTVLEVARTLLSSGAHFKKPIYLVWYSAEEMGLVGSQYVVADFKKKKIPVSEVIHFDMTGYTNKNDPTIWLVDDHVNKELTSYLETLINAYVKKPIKYTSCGYACSDHATWTSNGYKAALPFEAQFGKDDPYIHSSQDKMEFISLSHMTDFAKLGVAFVVEMAEPV